MKTLYDTVMVKDGEIPFAMPDWIALAPFEEFLGMKIVMTGEGTATLEMPFRAVLCQGMGLMHGGAMVALADTALAIAIKTILPQGTHFATIDLSFAFHAPVRWGTVQARAAVTSRAERDLTGEAQIVTEDGVTAATLRATFRIGRKKK